jgi:hypothetical protein
MGSHQLNDGSEWCDACPAGKYCSLRGMPEPRECPPGFLCKEGQVGSLNQLEPCPAGFMCLFGQDPAPCPDGHWCPEGTGISYIIAGNYTSPRRCGDGIVCKAPELNTTANTTNTTSGDQASGISNGVKNSVKNELLLQEDVGSAPDLSTANGVEETPSDSTFEPIVTIVPQPRRRSIYTDLYGPNFTLDPPVAPTFTFHDTSTDPNTITLEATGGASNPMGVEDCPPGTVCKAGISEACPQGTFCNRPGGTEARECPPGTFLGGDGASQCQICPPGTFCFFMGQSVPYKCRPGFTCHLAGAASPTQPCPAGSYCPAAVASNTHTSTMQKETHPNLCSEATYCLWGASTPEVNPADPQAA